MPQPIQPEKQIRQRPIRAKKRPAMMPRPRRTPAPWKAMRSKPLSFQELAATNHEINPGSDVNRLGEVKVVLSAELGRTKIRIVELLSLLEGSVVELDKAIESPVELIAQGVPLGNGEVVVVDDCFAIRIKEIYSNSQRSVQS